MNQEKTYRPLLKMGQNNRPNRELLQNYFNDIFERQYYTESGPLVRQLETVIGDFLGVSHVVCVSNPSIAWLMLFEATRLSDSNILLPTILPKHVVEAAQWMKFNYRHYHPSKPNAYRAKASDLVRLLPSSPEVVVAANRWGGACDLEELQDIAAARKAPLLLDSSESFGCRLGERAIGAWGTAEVFSFAEENLINGAGSACICTQDEALADRLRCMRSSGGIIRQVTVSKTVNGRMSEAQAAFALMSFDSIDRWLNRNKIQHALYKEELSDLPELRFISGCGVTISNYQQLVIDTNKTSSLLSLVSSLRKDGFHVQKIAYNPITSEIDSSEKNNEHSCLAIELPVGSNTSLDLIIKICRDVKRFTMNQRGYG